MTKLEPYLIDINTPAPEHLRHGQNLFNTLYRTDPDLANEIRGTVVDPFYHNGKIDEFLEYVKLHLVG